MTLCEELFATIIRLENLLDDCSDEYQIIQLKNLLFDMRHLYILLSF